MRGFEGKDLRLSSFRLCNDFDTLQEWRVQGRGRRGPCPLSRQSGVRVSFDSSDETLHYFEREREKGGGGLISVDHA